MNIEPCPHEQLYPLEPCTPCQNAGEPPPRTRSRTEVGPPFVAKFESVCPGCGFDVVPGQVAQMVARPGREARAHHGGACTKEAA